MATVPGFAQGICPPLAYRRNGHQATFANAAEFFNSLLDLDDINLEALLRRPLRPRLNTGLWT